MLTTPRLILRRWLPADREPFAAMNADPAVMEHFPRMLTGAESNELVDRIEAEFGEHGFGMWAVESAATSEFLGFTGLSVPGFDAPFLPATEIGWRFARHAWGHGYATEAARAALAYGFGEARLTEIVSFTTTANVRSRAVMERIGMARDPVGDFDHPRLPDWPQRRHVLYRIAAHQRGPSA